MKILFQILVSGSLFFYSCSQATKEKSTEESGNTTTVVNPATTSPAESEPSEDSSKPVESASNVALNPAHGMPGHRCDIEVGQPLTSAPAEQKVAAPVQNATQPDMGPLRSDPAPAAPLPTKPVATRLNPAHGQPGHDCAVAVGAPLKN